MRGVATQTLEDKTRVTGEGLLVVESADQEGTDPGSTYVVAMSDSAVGLVRGGSDLAAGSVCGRVLFCCRPPVRASEAPPLSASGSQMVQV